MNHADTPADTPPMPAARTRAPTHAPLSDDDLEWLRAYVHEHGERAATRATGLSRNTIARGCAGLGLYPGSHALIRSARERR